MLGSIIVGGAVAAFLMGWDAVAPARLDLDRIGKALRAAPCTLTNSFSAIVPTTWAQAAAVGAAYVCIVTVLGTVLGMKGVKEDVYAVHERAAESAEEVRWQAADIAALRARLTQLDHELCMLRIDDVAECARMGQ